MIILEIAFFNEYEHVIITVHHSSRLKLSILSSKVYDNQITFTLELHSLNIH